MSVDADNLRKHRGTDYEIICEAIDTMTLKEVVICRNTDTNDNYVFPKDTFYSEEDNQED